MKIDVDGPMNGALFLEHPADAMGAYLTSDLKISGWIREAWIRRKMSGGR